MTARSGSKSVVGPFCCLAMALFMWPAMLTFDAGDWPSPNQFPHNEPASNACGVVGAWLSYYFHYFLGDGSYPLLLFATMAAALRMVRGSIGSFFERVIGLILVVLVTAASTHLIPARSPADLPVGSGGVIGHALGSLLARNLNGFGTFFILASCLVVGLIFATEGWILSLPAMLRKAGDASGRAVASARAAAWAARPKPVTAGVSAEESAELLQAAPPASKKRKKKAKPPVEEETLFEDEEEEDDEYEYEYVYEDEEDEEEEVVGESDGYEEEEEEEVEAAPESEKAKVARLKKAAKALRGPKVNFSSPSRTESAEAYPQQIENWMLPDLNLLDEPEYGFSAQQESVVREQAAVLEQTLEEFRLDASVVEIDTGPVITMFELRLGAGIKVAQIASLSNDIARALKSHAIRVVAPITGKNTVGIEVPNAEKETVRLKELMTLSGKKAAGMGLPLFLGKDAGGGALVADLTKMPHCLIAGTTGSGKSVCLNSVVLSLLMTQRPDHVKMIMVDPKMVEMSQFKDVPHLMCPIVTDMAKAEKILEWAVTTMEERYAILAEARVKNIASYNALGADELYKRFAPATEDEKKQIATRLPYIVVIIDELADLMMTSAKEVEHHLSRLAQKSRAVGVHIIVATQRPEAKVVTGLIKSNLPSRVCFRVASRMDSRIVLDQNGGEVLMGQGDMLFLPPGAHKLVRAQGTYLGDAEIQAVLDDLSSRSKPDFHPGLMQVRNPTDTNSSMRDPLFDDAVRVVLESRRGSVSLLQRRLTIGYSRASRLVDQMADAGIVGDYKGSQAREVQMTIEEWNALKAQVAADLDDGYEADEEEVVEVVDEVEEDAGDEEEGGEEGSYEEEVEEEEEQEDDEAPQSV